MSRRILGVVCSGVLMAAGHAAAVDVVGNGGFEEIGFFGPESAFLWDLVSNGGPGTGSTRSSVSPISGDYSQYMIANGTPSLGATAGVTQNCYAATAGVSLVPGSTVQLSFSAKGNAGPGGVGFYALRVLNVSGAIVANSGLQVFFPGASVAQYSTAALTVPAFGEPPNDGYFAFVEIVVAAGAFDGSTINATIDNVMVEGTIGEGGPACPADFNQDGGVDGADIEAFFTVWETGDPSADVNADGGVDGTDVETFFAAWEAGGC